MLDDALKQQLRDLLTRIVRPVAIVADLDAGAASARVRELLDAVCAQSDRVSWREGALGSRQPTFAIGPEGETARMRFCGVPLGHEFSSLVLALLHAGGHPPRVDDELREQIEALSGEHHFETFVSLSCQTCPGVVQALNLFATLNPNVTHTLIDGADFPDEVETRGILSVPMVLRNGEVFAQGAINEVQLLRKLDESAGEREVEALERRAPYDVLVIGGGPAGASAAVYAARKGIRTGLVAERFGGQLQDTAGIENFISVPSTQGPELSRSLEQHVREYDVDLILDQRVETLLDREQTDDGLVHLRLTNGATLRTRIAILATGASWRTLGVPGEAEYRNRGVAYCPHCDGPLFKGKRVAVIGGGNSGVEAAIDLAGLVEHVTVLEFEDTLRADAALQTKARSLANVSFVTSAQTTEVLGDGERVTGLAYSDRPAGDEQRGDKHTLDLEGVFVQIGLLPNTAWLEGSRVRLSPHGEIEVDGQGATSAPGVFAAGDVTTIPTKQIIVAMGDGANAALGAFDHFIRLPGTDGASEPAPDAETGASVTA